MLFIYYPKCSTCLKAKKYLIENEINFEERDIVKDNPTYKELKTYYKNSGLPLKKFFNTSGNLYKELNLKEKLPSMTEDEMLQILSTNGMLVKRPLLIDENMVLVGFKENEWYGILEHN